LKARVKEISGIIAEVVAEINKLSRERQQEIVEQNWPDALTPEKREAAKTLPPLPNAGKHAQIVTRFSPNPDAPLHLCSARAIVLCSEYAKSYGGEFLVRFEDTDPKQKRPQLQFYESIKQDLVWLDCKPSRYFIQSDRLPTYYDHAERLLKAGHAYVDTCSPDVFRKRVLTHEGCPCRNLPPKEQLERWQNTPNGTYQEGEAVVRVKTDLDHPNPAIRDWPALRIIDAQSYPHPRVGSKYRVWPLYNLACGVDDHLLGITHIIRGKEHLTNQVRQEYMYKYFGWTYPETIHYGRMKIVGASLSKSKIVEAVRTGRYKSWDDPRLATFAALRRRGIRAEAIRQLIIGVGPKTQDITISWENLYALNRKAIEILADRYFFIPKPRKVTVHELPQPFTAEVPLHPDDPSRGVRRFEVVPKNGTAKFWVAERDTDEMAKNQVIRFMELFNVRVVRGGEKTVEAAFHSQEYTVAKEAKAKLIHWLPETAPTVKCIVVLPDASTIEGLAETTVRSLCADTIIQFERFGFVRIDTAKEGTVRAYYAHR
jgi:glutamyl-tRNA synthetase